MLKTSKHESVLDLVPFWKKKNVFPTLFFEIQELKFEFQTLFFEFPTLIVEFQTLFFKIKRLKLEIL